MIYFVCFYRITENLSIDKSFIQAKSFAERVNIDTISKISLIKLIRAIKMKI